jgi:glutathionyl-hydroquinone reductase
MPWCVVPVLWDAKEETIVNNESSEVIRIFNDASRHFLRDAPYSGDVPRLMCQS